MSVKILFFGRLADIAGNSVSMETIDDTDSLVRSLHQIYPALADVRYVIAVNKKVINGNTALDNDSEIALLPPFSGG